MDEYYEGKYLTKPKVWAIITARKGSERLPDKNIRKIGKYNLIQLAWLCAIECDDIDEIVITTDYDPNNFYLPGNTKKKTMLVTRPEELCGPKVSSWDVVDHAAGKVGVGENDIVVLLQPTSPFRSPQDISETIKMGSYSTHEEKYPKPNGAVYIRGGLDKEPYIMPWERSVDIDTEEQLVIARACLATEKELPGEFGIWHPELEAKCE